MKSGLKLLTIMFVLCVITTFTGCGKNEEKIEEPLQVTEKEESLNITIRLKNVSEKECPLSVSKSLEYDSIEEVYKVQTMLISAFNLLPGQYSDTKYGETVKSTENLLNQGSLIYTDKNTYDLKLYFFSGKLNDEELEKNAENASVKYVQELILKGNKNTDLIEVEWDGEEFKQVL